MVKVICWDMDGTIANLYGVENWLSKLDAHDPSPYAEATPMWDMARLSNLVSELMKKGIVICITTWLSRTATEEYKKQIRTAKREWLTRNNFPYDHFYGVRYGATKADSVRHLLAEGEEAILVDDSAKVRAGWHLGETIDPTKTNILEWLESLI
jgi:hypothetical protein